MQPANRTEKFVGLRVFALALLSLALTGCESSVSIQTPISEADYRDYAKPGNLSISGQLPRYSGMQVHLDPASPYTDALYVVLGGHGRFATANEDETAQISPIVLEHRRTVVADTDGAFAFDHLPPGRYYLSWYDSWTEHDVAVNNKDPLHAGIEPMQQYNFDSPQGRWRFKEVTVRPGQNLDDVNFD